MTLDSFFNSSEPQSFHLKNRKNNSRPIYYIVWLQSSIIIDVKEPQNTENSAQMQGQNLLMEGDSCSFLP